MLELEGVLAGRLQISAFPAGQMYSFFCRVIEEGIVNETPVCFSSKGHRLGHIGGDVCIVTSLEFFALEVTSVSH